MNHLKDNFYYYPNACGTKFCNDVVRFSRTIKKKKALTGNGVTPSYNIRKSKVAWLSEKWVYNHLLKFIHDANRPDRFNFNLCGAEAIQYTRYSGQDNNKDHYDWHQDSSRSSSKKIRKLSLICNLTDPNDFEGGDLFLNFPKPNPNFTEQHQLHFMKKQGAIVIFPSFLWHKVAPVTKGIRHSLVCGMNGEYFK